MVVSRYEMGKFAADDACARLYIEALAKSGQMDKIWPSAKPLHDGTATTTTTTATGDTGTPMANLLQSALAGGGHKRAGSEGITGAVAGMAGMGGSGVKENPIHVVVDERKS